MPMPCPKDGSELIEVERQGIEIDYCPTCKGVWLDRSELDQLIARSTTPGPEADYAEPPRRESRGRAGGIMGRARQLLDDDRRDRDDDRSRRGYDDYDDDRPRGGYDYDDDDDDRRYPGRRKKKRRDMLEDLFDF